MKKHFLIWITGLIFLLLSFTPVFGEVNENFDGWTGSTAYGNYLYNGFQITNGLRDTAYPRGGTGSDVRLRNATPQPSIEYVGDDGNGKDGGVGTISFWYRSWDGVPAFDFTVSYSIDGGGYIDIETVTGVNTTDYTLWTHDLNDASDNIKILITTTYQERMHIDDFYIGDYTGGGCDTDDTTPPDWGTPGISNISVTNPGTNGNLDIDWDDATDAENPSGIRYAVYRDTSSGFTPGAGNRIATGLSSSQYADSGLTNGTPYYYRVEVWNCNANSQIATDEGTGTPTAPVPDTIYSVQYNETTPGSAPDCYPSPRISEVGVTLNGIVTVVGTNNYVIAESSAPWSSIYIYDPGRLPAPVIGDDITITGTVAEYFGLTQMSTITYYNTESTGNTVHGPYTITCEGYGGSADWGIACDTKAESIESLLVTLYNVEVSSPVSNFGYWRIKDQGGTLHLSCDDTYYAPTSGDIVNGRKIDQITGVIIYTYGYYRLNPRSAADIVFADCNTGDSTPPDWATPGVSNLVVVNPGTGGALNLDWDDATDAENPASVMYAVYRDTSSGFSPGTGNRIATGLTSSDYGDSGLTNGTPYYYRIETYNCNANTRYNTDEGTGTPTLISYDPGDVVFNEFLPKGTEWIELYNNTGNPIDLDGWTIENYTGTVGTVQGSHVIAAGGFLILEAADMDVWPTMSNDGDLITLKQGSVVIDKVGCGIRGSAPLAPTGYSVARVVDGVDTDDDAADFNLCGTLIGSITKGTSNTGNVPAVSLGTSLIINEIDWTTAGNDMVEIYNPTGVAVDLTGFILSDGDAYAALLTTPVVPAGGVVVLEETVDFPGTMDIGALDVVYLFSPLGVRIDQLGFYNKSENYTLQRIPDGSGPNDGYDWTTSGGCVSLFDVPSTLGSLNGTTVVPSTVSDLAAEGAGYTYATLSWTAPEPFIGCTGTASTYDVRYSLTDITDEAAFLAATQASGEPSPSSSGTAETYTLQNLNSNTTYYIAMRTQNSMGAWSPISNVISIHTGVIYATGTSTIGYNVADGYHFTEWVVNVRFLNSSGQNATGITAEIVDYTSWVIVDDAVSAYPDIDAGTEQWSAEPVPFQFDLTNRPPSTNYINVWFNVTYTLVTKGSVSEVIGLTLKIPESNPVPQNVTAISVSEGIKIGWSEVAGSDGYNVYRLNNEVWTKLNDALLTKTSYLDKNVQDGIEYSYKVTSVKEVCESGYSAVAKAIYEAEYETLDEIVSYPNPAKDKVTFGKLPKGSVISIYTLTGEQVYTMTVKDAKSEWHLINEAGRKVGNGIYFY
ncbi:MAG TPA: hypothetical protein ENN73_04470, partial [Firmicutes bacterium]|nr:hypothetical protein [Bacillota bacterium]